MQAPAPIGLVVLLLLIGLFALRTGLTMQKPSGVGVVESWQRGWRLLAIVVGVVSIVASMVNIVRWCVR